MYLLAVNATYLTEVLTHIDLLERTVRFLSKLANIVIDKTDVKPVKRSKR